MTLTREQVLNLNSAINDLKKLKKLEVMKYFKLSILNIESKIKDEVNNILKTFEPSDEYKDFKSRRNEIVDNYAVIKSDGSYSIIEGGIEIQDSKLEQFKVAMEALNNKYFDVLEIRKKELEDFKIILASNIDIDIQGIDYDVVPDVLPQQIFDFLIPVMKVNI